VTGRVPNSFAAIPASKPVYPELTIRNPAEADPPWLSDDTQQLIQQRNDLRGRAAAVEQTHNRAEQVAEKIPRPRDGNDVEYDLIEVYLEPEQIEIERTTLHNPHGRAERANAR
jgi:hypothetical protein